MKQKFLFSMLSLLILIPTSAFADGTGPNPIQVLLSGPFGALCVAVFALIGIACFLFSGGGNSHAKKVGSSESMLLFGSVCLIIAVVVYFKRVNFEHQKLKFTEEQKAHYNIY